MARSSASPETHERPHNRVYRTIYRSHHGSGPYECHGCHKPMERLEIVHHLDENPWNNSIENLAAMHTVCHNREHHVGITMSKESNERRRQTFMKTLADMTKEERQAAYNQTTLHLGAKRSEETKRRIADALKKQAKVSCIVCRRVMVAHALDQHLAATRKRRCVPWQT